ncbi:MAG: heme-binding protein [Deltaproteobacteria bacterium]|nr:heme-binding protein [Deltaproteobacteria bacterium]
MKWAARPIVGLVITLLGASAMATETPKHQVLARYRDFEVREYPSLVVAETEVEGDRGEADNEGFSRLAGYIFGRNHSAKKIAMTAPVTEAPVEEKKIAMTAPVTEESAGPRRWRMQFMMPSELPLEALPEPNDARVHLRVLPPRRFAAIRYSGRWSQQNYDEHLEQLQAAMQREGLSAKGEPVWARYDPPFKPWFLRTNEILIEVQSP